MNETLFEIALFGATWKITAWKVIGLGGATLFFMRWPIQMLASRRAGRPVVPTLFWVLSMVGSALCLLYFTWGKNDSVGILQNLFPAFVSAYNLILDRRHRKDSGPGAGAGSPVGPAVPGAEGGS